MLGAIGRLEMQSLMSSSGFMALRLMENGRVDITIKEDGHAGELWSGLLQEGT